MDLNALTHLLSQGSNLSEEQAYDSADLLASSEVGAEDKADFLTALARKGESADEVTGLAKRFRELARDPGLDAWRAEGIDVCGTGGDKIGSFNISTTVAFGLAAAGVPVLKHGNNSITSKCGSANLLTAFGVELAADDATLQRSTKELNFCFMFAPSFHPAFKEIMPVRKRLAEQGQRTVFNVLGPLINPARPANQLLGVYKPELVELMGNTLQQLGMKSGLVVHCRLPDGRGMDELSVAGLNEAFGFGELSDLRARWAPKDFGLQGADVQELLGGDVEENLRILDNLLDGRAPRGLEDTVACNMAAAFLALGKCSDVQEGAQQARDLLLGGAVRQKIEQIKDFYSSL